MSLKYWFYSKKNLIARVDGLEDIVDRYIENLKRRVAEAKEYDSPEAKLARAIAVAKEMAS